MTRIDLEIIRKCQQLVVKARIQLRGTLARATWQIGSTNCADKQDISSQHEPWLGSSFEIRHDEADTVRRMAGRVEHLHAGVAEFDLVTIAQCGERELHICRLVDAVRRVDAPGQLTTTGAVIRMNMRVDDMRQSEALGRRECDVGVDVVRTGVDDGSFAQGAAAEEIRGAAEIEVVVRPKNHRSPRL